MMTTSATSSARDITVRSPFTPSQWQELEHQALIFKYMVSGVAIPPELIYSVKRSLDSSMNTRLFPHQPIGWGCFQVGFGRKADPEPGRCRRTDGKKWRCSKEAYPDSKYCERHMHRGRNRSRKPVEIIPSSSSSNCSSSSSSSSSSSASTTATLISSSTLLNRNLSMINSTSTTTVPLMSSEIYQDPLTHHQKSTYLNNPYLYPPHQQNRSTYNMISSSGFSSPHDHINNTTNTPHQMFLDSGSCSDKDYRYFHGIKDHQGVVDERDFFPEASGSVRGGINIHHHHQDSICQPLMTTNSFKGYSHDHHHHHQSHQFHQSFSHHNSKPQHCFVLGTDFKSSTSSATRAQLKIDKEDHDHGDHDDDETQKPLHHFFGEWPPKNNDSAWLDLASNSRVHKYWYYYSSIMDNWTPPLSNTVQKSTCWWVISDLFLVENFVAGRNFGSAF
ncbi:hypothetical protein Ddye_012122 [Dipteronia dyeriana]|uniref:Growth-regulating factor n=1 Tax=Dipteronia dyeriana TaxID=168575 RepID=A0AAD9X3V9_9ROSI|nr:hypothetical protein Ddye_012122 [Dipteronia dyeriana]